MIGLLGLEVYNSVFNISEEINNFKLYKFADSYYPDISYTTVKNEIERDLDISDISATDLQDDILGLILFKEYREQLTKSMKDVGYTGILAGYL